MPTELLYKGLTAPVKASPARAVKIAPEGIVTAIVAVTGVVDAVDDLIVPGAFTWTLKHRHPKVVDDHEWKNKAGRVLHNEEWLPGDPRLPKRTKDGKPWPAAAGALVATMQYNLRSERGRESFEWVRFYAESNEAEFSIGYKVPDGKARQRKDGVRVILLVDLFEYSHVLFGAAPLSMALDVKNLHGLTGGAVTIPAQLTPSKRKTVEEDPNADALDNAPEPEYDPDAEWDDHDPDVPMRAGMEAKTAADVLLEVKSGNAGNPEGLRKWFAEGADGAIPWGFPGDFDACVGVASRHMSPEDAKGYCNLRHKDALGIYPATHAKLEGKSMNTMKGSYQERERAIEVAASDLFRTFVDEGQDSCTFVVATYDTEVIVNTYVGNEATAYRLSYAFDPDTGGVELGAPEKVALALVAQIEDSEVAREAADDDLDQMVVGSMLSHLATAGHVARMEGKVGDLVRGQLATLGVVSVKSAEGTPAEEATETPATEAAEPTDDGDEDLITVDTLPDGDWAMFRKTEPIKAMHVDEPFTVETREGPVHVDDEGGGWLAVDSDGYPYPIADEEFENVYAPDDGSEDAPADQGDAPADTASDPESLSDYDTDDESLLDDEAMGDDDPEEETVTLPADEHYAAMDALDVDDEDAPEGT